ncbi:Hypothetical predicted protein, partial [Marmota monax]
EELEGRGGLRKAALAVLEPRHQGSPGKRHRAVVNRDRERSSGTDTSCCPVPGARHRRHPAAAGLSDSAGLGSCQTCSRIGRPRRESLCLLVSLTGQDGCPQRGTFPAAQVPNRGIREGAAACGLGDHCLDPSPPCWAAPRRAPLRLPLSLPGRVRAFPSRSPGLGALWPRVSLVLTLSASDWTSVNAEGHADHLKAPTGQSVAMTGHQEDPAMTPCVHQLKINAQGSVSLKAAFSK